MEENYNWIWDLTLPYLQTRKFASCCQKTGGSWVREEGFAVLGFSTFVGVSLALGPRQAI